MKNKLDVGIQLPLETVTQRIGIIGQTGTGILAKPQRSPARAAPSAPTSASYRLRAQRASRKPLRILQSL